MSKPLQTGEYTLWYRDYKEPLEQLEGGFTGQPRGVLLGDGPGDDAKPVCAFCWPPYAAHNLGPHLRVVHGMTARAFKTEVGLKQRTALVSEPTRRKMIARSLRAYLKPDSVARNSLDQGRAFLSANPTARGKRPRANPEHLNKTGRCYAQVLAVARSIARTGRLTMQRLRQAGISQEAIEMWFPNDGIHDLNRLVGQNPKFIRWTDDQLLTGLRSVADKLGRTPSHSDLKREGLPAQITYRSHFGSYGNACRKLGLDPNLPVPMTTDLETRILAGYATIGSAHKVAGLLHLSDQRVLSVMHHYGYPYPPGYSGPGRKEWAADMARRIAGWPEETAA